MIVKEVIKMQFIEKLEIDKVKLWDKNPRINDEASESNQKRVHPTQKPIALALHCFDRYDFGKNVLDLFGGSGSTLLAAEQSGRTCFMMEIVPYYVDVIIKRYIDYKKSDEDVFVIRDGEKYAYSEVTKS